MNKVYFLTFFLIFITCNHFSHATAKVFTSMLYKINKNRYLCFVPKLKRYHSVFSVKYNLSF